MATVDLKEYEVAYMHSNGEIVIVRTSWLYDLLFLSPRKYVKINIATDLKEFYKIGVL